MKKDPEIFVIDVSASIVRLNTVLMLLRQFLITSESLELKRDAFLEVTKDKPDQEYLDLLRKQSGPQLKIESVREALMYLSKKWQISLNLISTIGELKKTPIFNHKDDKDWENKVPNCAISLIEDIQNCENGGKGLLWGDLERDIKILAESMEVIDELNDSCFLDPLQLLQEIKDQMLEISKIE